MKQAKCIFWVVVLYSFAIQFYTMSLICYPDTGMWANQIEYFLKNDPHAFDFYLAYGHPGTTLVGLGSLLHIIFGVSYTKAVILSMSILIGGTTAACAVICFLLYQQSLWWLTTAFILTFSRLYFNATPPTATVLPFTVLIVVTTWWLWEYDAAKPRWPFFLWGGVVGLSAATRLDATLLVSIPMCVLIWYRHRSRVIALVVAGAGISFFVADPFLWFMPLQHISDLARKFLLHYDHYRYPSAISFKELALNIPFAVMSIVWWLVLLRFRVQTKIMPSLIMNAFLSITLVASIIILSSSFQDIRYFYPFIIVWETFLPLFALESFAPSNRHEPASSQLPGTAISWAIVCFFVLMQFVAYLFVI